MCHQKTILYVVTFILLPAKGHYLKKGPFFTIISLIRKTTFRHSLLDPVFDALLLIFTQQRAGMHQHPADLEASAQISPPASQKHGLGSRTQEYALERSGSEATGKSND